MKERPILFSAPMVRAILSGTKTVTRRVYKPRPQDSVNDPLGALWSLPSPYGNPGDQLWVKETHAFGPICDDPDDWRDNPDDWAVFYRADGDERPWKTSNDEDAEEIAPPWRPSIFMPRWASRITLEVVSVRVERLHEITEEDARAEGVERHDDDGVTYYGPFNRGHALARVAFERLWDEINGERAPWNSNPWVWRVEFRTTTPRQRGMGRP